MEKQKSNKTIILYILKMLKEGSSQDHPITQQTITKALHLLGYKCTRKTVASNIDALIEFGYKIVKIPGGGCYLNKTRCL